ncbi:hypothetical protein K431DRAFT_123497 [Polychaeton citri CBS 116435]|uniref:Uncharacterized protein n=1 Tax=Polychaeton citri CBS 116435 TaxID=1314669 RepID=A0A9P4Q3V9_9PEZI|nr:hypothetical protein K431DRAFT_123497 [Polychaeton citri CBS 116435]
MDETGSYAFSIHRQESGRIADPERSSVMASAHTRRSRSWSFASLITLFCVVFHPTLLTCSSLVTSRCSSHVSAYREDVERIARGDIDTISKQNFTSLYSPARDRAMTKRNNLAGWSESRLFPFNPDRVLRCLPASADVGNIARAEARPAAAPVA